MVKLPYKLAHCVSSSLLVVHKLLTAWAPGPWGGWSQVGVETTAGDAEATDGALQVVPRGWSEAWGGIWNTADDPGVVKLVMLADAEDEAGALVAVDVRERDAHE